MQTTITKPKYQYTGKKDSMVIAQKDHPQYRISKGDQMYLKEDQIFRQGEYWVKTQLGIFPAELFHSKNK